MTFKLEFEDKYRLWSTVVQGAADRIFIATDVFPPIGGAVPVRLLLPSQHLELTLKGVVVGRRRGGERFASGVYLRFSSDDLKTCRSHFGLAQDPERYKRSRRAPRVHRELPVRLKDPDLATAFTTRNISQTGLLMNGVGALGKGQQVALELTLDDGATLALRAEVAWVDPGDSLCGLRFLELSPADSEKLTAAVHRLLSANVESAPVGRRGAVIAEGDEPSLALLHEVLELHKMNILPAQTGEDVISITRWLRPSMVFLDILMPGVDAVDVCRLMRADPELADIPIIFFSQLDPARLHTVADEAGATDYLVKPAVIGELYRLVARYLPPVKE